MYSFCLFAKPHFASCPQVTFPLSHFLTTSRTLQNMMKKKTSTKTLKKWRKYLHI